MARPVRVDITADSSGFKAGVGEAEVSLQELNAVGKSVSGGLKSADAATESAGRTFARTGKVAKAAGKVIKSSGLDAASAGAGFLGMVPALSGVSSGMGALLVQGEALAGVLGGAGASGLTLTGAVAVAAPALAALAPVAVAVGLGYAFLHDRVSASTVAMRLQDQANDALAASTAALDQSVNASKDGLTAVRAAQLGSRQAALSLVEANRNLAAVEKESGKGSLEYRQALLSQQQAQEAVRTSREDLLRQGAGLIAQSKATSDEIEKNTATVKANADAARKREVLVHAGLISGKDLVGVQKEIRTALDAEAKAAGTAAAKHRDNAQRTREMAKEAGTATPRLKAIHDRLIDISNTELNLAKDAEEIARLGREADIASGKAQALFALLASPHNTSPISFPTLGGLTPVGPGGGAKGGTKGADEFGRRRGGPRPSRSGGSPTPLTISDRAGNLIADRHRDDTRQDKAVEKRARTAATQDAGITNPDKIDALGEKAVFENRKREIDADRATTQSAIRRVNATITARRAVLQKLRANRRNVKGKTTDDVKAKQAKITEQIRAVLAQIRSLFDERRALQSDVAELISEAADIQYDITSLRGEIEAMPDAPPPDPASAADPGPSSEPSSSADGGAAAAAGISPDAQAQIDQANSRTATADRGSAIGSAFIRTLFGSGSIDPASGSAGITINVEGSLVHQGELARFVVSALGGQGSVPASTFSSAA